MSVAVTRRRLLRQWCGGLRDASFGCTGLTTRLVSLVLLCTFTLVADPALAQRSRPWFQIYNWDGEVAFDLRNEYDLLDSSREETVQKSEWLFSEEMSLGADGWLYHPAFMRFSTEVGLVLQQDIVDTTPDTGTTQVDGLQLNFDVDVGLLPEKPYPITLFASQAHTQVAPPFSERRTINALRYGGGVHFRDLAIGKWELPTRVFYRHFDTDVKGRFSNTRKRDEIDFVMDNETRRTRNRLEYDWESIETESVGATRSQNRHTLQGLQDFFLDDGGRFSSRLLFRSDETDDFDILAANVNESLSLIHEHRLRSNYNYAFSFQDSSAGEQMSNGGGIGLSHQLYESLSSFVNIGASHSSSELGNTFRVGGGPGFQYTKVIPGGTFGLRFSPTYSYQDENTEAGILHQNDEAHSVTLIDPIFTLDNLCVLDATIEILDAVTFVPLVAAQFTILPRTQACDPARIRIDDPTITSVIVDYDYEVLPARTFTTLVLAAGFSLSLWDHLSLDLSYADTDQTLLNGVEDRTNLTDSQLLLGMLNLVFSRNRTRLEYERLRSDINPRNRFSASHTYSARPTARTRLGLGARYSYNRFTDTGRTTNGATLTANGTAWLPFRILGRANLFGRYLSQEEQDSFAVGGNLSLSYQYGAIRFEIQDRLIWNDSETKTGIDQSVSKLQNSFHFRISRPF